MNISNREVVEQFRGAFKLINSDANALLADRWVLSRLHNVALLYVKQRTDRKALFNNSILFKEIPCLEMISVPIGECCTYQSDLKIRRSKLKLPKIAQGSDNNLLIRGLWSIDTVSRRFIESDPNRYTNSLSLGQKSSHIHYWIMNSYLYLGTSLIEKVKISACFEEEIPMDLIGYPAYCKDELAIGCCPDSNETSIQDMTKCCPINPYDEEFPCPGYLIPDVLKALEKEFMETYGRSTDVNKTTGITKP